MIRWERLCPKNYTHFLTMHPSIVHFLIDKSIPMLKRNKSYTLFENFPFMSTFLFGENLVNSLSAHTVVTAGCQGEISLWLSQPFNLARKSIQWKIVIFGNCNIINVTDGTDNCHKCALTFCETAMAAGCSKWLESIVW